MRTKPPAQLSLSKATDLLRLPDHRLMLMHSNRPGEEHAYYIVPGGYVSRDIAEAIIARDDVRPMNDGLLPDSPQSWVLGYDRIVVPFDQGGAADRRLRGEIVVDEFGKFVEVI